MITYKELILEASQRGSLYHYTSPHGAKNILALNRIDGGEWNNKVSTTRDKNFHKKAYVSTGSGSVKTPDRRGVKTSVSFVLNGDKISQNYPVKPFSAWKNRHSDDTDENEERIGRPLKNAKKYITKIRVHHEIDPEHLKELESHGIPIEHTYK